MATKTKDGKMYIGTVTIHSGSLSVSIKVEKFNLNIRDDGKVYVSFKQQFSRYYGNDASPEETQINFLLNRQREPESSVFDVAGLKFEHKNNMFLKLDLMVDLRDGFLRFEDGLFTVEILGDHSYILGSGRPEIQK